LTYSEKVVSPLPLSFSTEPDVDIWIRYWNEPVFMFFGYTTKKILSLEGVGLNPIRKG